MPYPPLTDQRALEVASTLRLRNLLAVLQRDSLMRRVVELTYWSKQRARDAALQRYLSRPDYKRIAAGDKP